MGTLDAFKVTVLFQSSRSQKRERVKCHRIGAVDFRKGDLKLLHGKVSKISGQRCVKTKASPNNRETFINEILTIQKGEVSKQVMWQPAEHHDNCKLCEGAYGRLKEGKSPVMKKVPSGERQYHSSTKHKVRKDLEETLIAM